MDMETIKTKINDEHKYALGFMAKDSISVIETYSELDELKTAYFKLISFALERKLPSPLPLELINFKNGVGQCKILEEIIKGFFIKS